MIFYTWFIKIKVILNAKINYKKLTYKYLQNNRRKAAEEIKHLEHFTHWPIAKAKSASVIINERNSIVKNKRQSKLHYLPFYPYQRKAYVQNKVIKKVEIKFSNIDKVKKHF